MALRLKNGAVFLHIPKTGGNWVTRVLEELNLVDRKVGNKHANPAEVLNALHGVEIPFVFCFVRNPLSWYESWFKYQTAKGWLDFGSEREWHPCQALNGLGDPDFNKFISKVLNMQPHFLSRMYSGYTCVSDFTGKQENLVEDFIAVLDEMNVDFDKAFVRHFDRIGASPQTKILWDDELRKRVQRTDTKAFIWYGYTE